MMTPHISPRKRVRNSTKSRVDVDYYDERKDSVLIYKPTENHEQESLYLDTVCELGIGKEKGLEILGYCNGNIADATELCGSHSVLGNLEVSPQTVYVHGRNAEKYLIQELNNKSTVEFGIFLKDSAKVSNLTKHSRKLRHWIVQLLDMKCRLYCAGKKEKLEIKPSEKQRFRMDHVCKFANIRTMVEINMIRNDSFDTSSLDGHDTSSTPDFSVIDEATCPHSLRRLSHYIYDSSSEQYSEHDVFDFAIDKLKKNVDESSTFRKGDKNFIGTPPFKRRRTTLTSGAESIDETAKNSYLEHRWNWATKDILLLKHLMGTHGKDYTAIAAVMQEKSLAEVQAFSELINGAHFRM